MSKLVEIHDLKTAVHIVSTAAWKRWYIVGGPLTTADYVRSITDAIDAAYMTYREGVDDAKWTDDTFDLLKMWRSPRTAEDVEGAAR